MKEARFAGFPRVIVHNAVSADGRISNFPADIGLYYELAATWPHEAILAGADTILTDTTPDPGDAVTEPPPVDPDDTRPVMVVPDSRGRIRNWLYLRQQPYWKNVLALVSRGTRREYLEYLQQKNVEYIVAGDDHVDFRMALQELRKRFDVKTIRVDSGGTLNGELFRAGLVDELSLLLHPALAGGTTPSSVYRGPDTRSPEDAIKLRLISVKEMKNGIVWLRYSVVR